MAEASTEKTAAVRAPAFSDLAGEPRQISSWGRELAWEIGGWVSFTLQPSGVRVTLCSSTGAREKVVSHVSFSATGMVTSGQVIMNSWGKESATSLQLFAQGA